MMKKLVGIILLIMQLAVVSAAHAFIVKKIDFKGLDRLTPDAVETYLPIKPGDNFLPSSSPDIIKSLYRTGFFDDISLSQYKQTLIIQVVERPTIGQLKVTGNSVIPTDKLTNVMKTMEIAEGRVYNPVVLDKIKQSLLNQYYQLGRYNARVDVTVTPMLRNRVLVKIDISEGLVAKVQKITMIGNHVFDENTLIKQLDLSTIGLFTFISQSDRYSEEKLEASLERLRNYYLDHGYIRFEIKSAQGSVTPDRKSVFVTIVIEEGLPYTIKNFQLEGDLVLPKEEILKKIHLKAGEVFSRQKVMETEKAITKLLGEKGYMFAAIHIRPEAVNDQSKELTLIFTIDPGKRTYIRHVMFSDNTRTNDEVLRREVVQMEASPASVNKLEESKHRLLLLPYIKDVEMSVNRVPEVDDQVDINYKVKEESAAQASFKLGYSSGIQGMILGAGLNHKNFLGTGNTVGLNFQRSSLEQIYAIDYTNPYYTESGISRNFSMMMSRVDPSAVSNLDTGYTINEYSVGVSYGIPVGNEENVFNRILVGATYENTLVHLSSDTSKISDQVNTFINSHGRHFQELNLKLGLTRDSRDKAIFPTRGSLQTLFLDTFAPLAKKSVAYYMLNYHAKWYQPLTDQFIFTSRADLGYGNGFKGARDYPFFKNFYAGGIDSVRGYKASTLGPRDSNNKAMGGNILVDASIGLIFPNYLSDNLRTSIFIDAGNVYSLLNNRKEFGGDSTNSGPLRYSIGLGAGILTPIGPVELGLSYALNNRHHDKKDAFQFNIGANF